jgi:hypothetical protein
MKLSSVRRMRRLGEIGDVSAEFAGRVIERGTMVVIRLLWSAIRRYSIRVVSSLEDQRRSSDTPIFRSGGAAHVNSRWSGWPVIDYTMKPRDPRMAVTGR